MKNHGTTTQLHTPYIFEYFVSLFHTGVPNKPTMGYVGQASEYDKYPGVESMTPTTYVQNDTAVNTDSITVFIFSPLIKVFHEHKCPEWPTIY